MRMGVSNKLLLGYSIILLLLVTMGLLMFITFDNVKKNVVELISIENKTQVFSKVKYGSRNLLIVNDFILGGNTWMHDYYLPETKLVQEQIEMLKKLPLDANQSIAIAQLEKEFARLNRWTILIVHYSESKNTTGAGWDGLIERIDDDALQIVELLETLSVSFDRELIQAQANHDQSIQMAKNFIIAIFFLSIGISLIVALKTNHIVIHPLQLLNDFTIRVSKGDLAKRLDITADDELGELASSFNTMVNQLQLSKEALLRSDEQHRLLFNHNPLPMLIYDLDTLSILRVNEAMVDKYGYTLEEFKHLTIKDLRPVEDLPALEEALEAIRSGVNKKAEWRHITKDETIINVEVYSTTISYMDKEARMVVIHDITIKKKAEKELQMAKQLAEESVKSKEIFLANMSHEIRTPMNAIMGMTQLLQKTNLSKKQFQYFDAVRTSAKHLLIIINDILDISKIQSGKMQFETIGFKIDQLIDTLVKSIEYKAIAKDFYIHYSIDRAARVVVCGDPVRLNQILLNLLSNAIKFTSEGEVELSCKVIKDWEDQLLLQFTVTDTGIGIPQEKTEAIFESFNQVDASTTRKFGGTGLGLSICKNLVQLQGGQIFVDSILEKGSTFGFTLMYAKGTEADLPQKENEIIDAVSLGQVKVLLVEDHEMNQLMATTIMEEWNFQVDTAGDGKVAIEKLKQNKYDVVLMDIQMPVMGGMEATKIIREELPAHKSTIPIIAVTANALKGDKEKYLAAGMNDYISKPFEAGVLFSKIARLLKGRNGNAIRVLNQSGSKETLRLNADPVPAKLYDLSMLKKISRGSDAIVLDMMQTFIETVRESLADLDAFYEKKEWDRVSDTAHRMKPSLDALGIDQLEKEIRLIESYAREQKNIERLPELVAKLNHICDKVNDGLQEEIKELSVS